MLVPGYSFFWLILLALPSGFLQSVLLSHRFRDCRPVLIIRSYFHIRDHKLLILLNVGWPLLAAAASTLRHAVKVILKAWYPWFEITLQTFILTCAQQDVLLHLTSRLNAREVESAGLSDLSNWLHLIEVQLFGCSFYFILGYLILSYAVVHLWNGWLDVDGGVFGFIWLG